MRIVIFVLAALLSMSAFGEGVARIGGKIVTEGMSVAEVRQKIRKPDNVVQLQNGFGAGIGQRWDYYEGKRVVMLTIASGQVVDISEQ